MINKNDLVSVIVPCYNIENYIERCIESIINQTYDNLEIIAIDDGSTDRTGKILDELEKEDCRIFVRHFSNGGPSAARNRGLNLMNGSYVMCVDGDDFIDNTMIENMYRSMKDTGASIAVCNYWLYFGKYNKKLGNTKTVRRDDMTSEMAIELLFDSSLRFYTPWGKLYQKELWNDLRYPEDVLFGEDMFLAHLLLNRAERICFLPEPYYYYNQEGESLVRSRFTINKLSMITACELWVKFCDEKFPNIRKKARWCYWERIINICTFLLDTEFAVEYKEYQLIIKKNIHEILRSRLTNVDKIKALLIAYSGQTTYGKIRMMLKRDRGKV